MARLISPGLRYITPANVRRTKQAIMLAFRTQMAGLGLSLVEVLSPCPVNWRLDPVDALEWIAKNMIPQYPLGEYKMIDAVKDLKKGEKTCTPK